ncbi:hypothetical protein SAMN03159341_101689 [Paenibacillus sp. 1_12]|uniref:S-Ena type endospore appendage n=1 Tax=Paenibacillus sp. 1_12 TaxID=1566278 RepID=UPI0008ED62FB|nr:S-Ena type endospore appendage [Paenibacillus sp. 1_12]SFK81325.1 hypothetical protein SAMN03159341_101689 [Paenibacillus sp. 1_12]
MSCSSSTSNCCERPIVSVCLADQSYPIPTIASTVFGPNPSPVAASGIVSNNSTNSATLTFTFRRGAATVATIGPLTPGQTRSFAIPGFTSISATASIASSLASLCMTEFFRASV